VTSVLEGSTDNVPLLGALANAYETAFREPDFAASRWLEVGREQEVQHPDTPTWAAEPLERALAVVRGPAMAADIGKSLYRAYVSAKEFTRARQVLEKALSLVPADGGLAKELSVLIAEAKLKEKKDLARVESEKKDIDRQKLAGELQHMKMQLDVARRQNKSDRDIRSIETTIKEISKKLVE